MTNLDTAEFAKKLKPKSRLVSVIGLLFLLMTFFCACGRTSYGYQAALMIANGRAAQYDREADARVKTAEQSAGQDVIFSPFTVKPSLLFFADLVTDPNEWPCNDYAEYYNLKSACLSE